jgi:hypothetical protein
MVDMLLIALEGQWLLGVTGFLAYHEALMEGAFSAAGPDLKYLQETRVSSVK